MSEFIFRFIVLTAITAVTGFTGAIIYNCLFWFPLPRKKQPNYIFHMVFGLASIILVVTSLGALGIRTNRTSLLLIFGGILGISITILVYKIKIYHQIPVSIHIEREYLWLVLLTLLFFIAKLIEIRNILVPNWVDGLVHVSILQKLVLKEAISPERIYHTGFHAGAIFFYYLFGLSLSNTVLLFGQWSSVLLGLTFYNFLRNSKIHHIFAILGMLVCSLMLLFPSYLVAWGRYPFLLGLGLIFPAITSTLEWMKNGKNYLEMLIFVCALTFTHYGSLLIWLSFLIAYFLNHIKELFEKQNILRNWILRLSLIPLPLLAVISPKLINFLGQSFTQTTLLSKSGNPDFGEDINFVFSLIKDHDLYFLLLVFMIFLATIIWKIRLPRRIPLTWLLVVLILVWMQYTILGFSISSYMNAYIFASVPVTILFVSSSQRIFTALTRSKGHTRKVILFFALLVFVSSGMFSSNHLISVGTTFFMKEDSLAMEWIEKNTSQDATFLIQSFIWGNKLMPSDGGGWIPILTGRNITYPMEIGELSNLADFLRANKVNYIYLGKEFDPDFSLRAEDMYVPYQIIYQTEHVIIIRSDLP